MNARVSVRAHGTEFGFIDGPTADRLNDVVTLLARSVQQLPRCQDATVKLRYSEGVLQSVVVVVPEWVMEEHREVLACLDFLDEKDRRRADSAATFGRDGGDRW